MEARTKPFHGEESITRCMQTSSFEYYVIRYVPDLMEESGIDFAVVAISDSQPSRIALKRMPSWAPLFEFDPEADVHLLNVFLNELSANIRLDSRYMDRASEWENCIRVLPPREFSTSDFENTFSLLSDAELGIG
jgi:hypothetical protein